MDALAGYESDEADNTETTPTSINIKKSEIIPETISRDQQDRTNGEDKKRSKKHNNDTQSKSTSLKYEKANTKTSSEEEKHKEKIRHRSRSRSRSSRSKSRSPDRSYKHKGRRSRSREHSRSRSRSRSRSPSHRSQKHTRHGNKRSNRVIDSSKKSRDLHRRKRRSRSRSTSRRRATRSRSRDRKRHSRSRSYEKISRRSRSRSRNRHSKRSRSREKPSRHRSRSRDRSSKKHEARNTKSESSEVPASGTNDTQKKNTELTAETSSKLPLKLNLSGSGQMTPQLAVQQAMAAVNAKAQQLTGISLPKYYNPAAVNPMKYAEQMQKRKLLWNCNKDKQVQPVVVQTTSNNKWEKTTFAQDLDGKMTAKFRKLMGIKSDEAGEEIVHDEKNVSEEQIRKQEEMFRKLDQQYEVARMSTHTHRGVGLGFSSQSHHLFPK